MTAVDPHGGARGLSWPKPCKPLGVALGRLNLKAFAKRGLGDGASQGSSLGRADGTGSYHLPAACRELVVRTSDGVDHEAHFNLRK